MINKYKKKPVIIEALQWTGDNIAEVWKFVENAYTNIGIQNKELKIWNVLEECWVNCPRSHYIIKGIKGEYYPCEPDVFNQTYELVKDSVLPEMVPVDPDNFQKQIDDIVNDDSISLFEAAAKLSDLMKVKETI